MTTNFSMRPIGVFFRFLGRMIFPRLIHLAFIADDVKEVSAVRTHLRMQKIKYRWHSDSIRWIWFRPNQISFVHNDLKGYWRDTKMKSFAKKYNIDIVYFADVNNLMDKACIFAIT